MSTTPLNERVLNAFSQSFARALFAIYPQWREFAELDEDHHTSTKFLVVIVKPPEASRADHPLVITTDNEEVTVGFDYYHNHLEWPPPDSEFGNPLRFISDILSERIAIASFWRDEVWLGSQYVNAGVTDLPPFSNQARLLRLRSWNGTFSTDLPARSPGP